MLTTLIAIAIPRPLPRARTSPRSRPKGNCPGRMFRPGSNRSLSSFSLSDWIPNERNLQLPFWALVSFGAYVLLRLGWGMLTFNDVPAAHKELMDEIEIAKKDLRAKGVDVD